MLEGLYLTFGYDFYPHVDSAKKRNCQSQLSPASEMGKQALSTAAVAKTP